jgi:hypothetical protein
MRWTDLDEMDREDAAELVAAFIDAHEERTGNPPEELRVSEEILQALSGDRAQRELTYDRVRLYLDRNLEGEIVELA